MPSKCNCVLSCAACVQIVQTFGQRHHWLAELGPLVCIGLSTTRFRSSPYRWGGLLLLCSYPD